MPKPTDILSRQTRRYLRVGRIQVDQLGPIVVRRIKGRTRRGVDINERRFVPYSPKYAKRKGVSRTAVDMTGRPSGGMVESVYWTRSRPSGGVQVRIRGARNRRLGRIHQENRRKRRQWFGLTTRDRRFLISRFTRGVRQRMQSDRRTAFTVVVK